MGELPSSLAILHAQHSGCWYCAVACSLVCVVQHAIALVSLLPAVYEDGGNASRWCVWGSPVGAGAAVLCCAVFSWTQPFTRGSCLSMMTVSGSAPFQRELISPHPCPSKTWLERQLRWKKNCCRSTRVSCGSDSATRMTTHLLVSLCVNCNHTHMPASRPTAKTTVRHKGCGGALMRCGASSCAQWCTSTPPPASQSHIINQTATAPGFEMCFGWDPQHPNPDSVNKAVQTTFIYD